MVIPANMIPLTHECMAAHLPDIVQVHRSKLVRLIFFLSPNPPSLFSINNLKICWRWRKIIFLIYRLAFSNFCVFHLCQINLSITWAKLCHQQQMCVMLLCRLSKQYTKIKMIMCSLCYLTKTQIFEKERKKG
jgi:hypothetical protein